MISCFLWFLSFLLQRAALAALLILIHQRFPLEFQALIIRLKPGWCLENENRNRNRDRTTPPEEEKKKRITMVNNYHHHLFTFSIFSATVILLLSTLALPSHACNNQTLEECSSEESCSGNRVCLGRNQNTDLVPCPAPNTPQCFCAPPGVFLSCKLDSDCPQNEGCAMSPRTGRQLCVGCKAIAEKSRNFQLVDLESTKCSQPRMPCARTLDFCSLSRPCVPRLQCVDRIDKNTAFLCSSGSTACRCEPPRGQQFFTPCDDPTQCPHRETCTFVTTSHVNACISCDIAKRDIFFKGMLQTCKDLTPRPDPKYIRSSNGLNFDLCIDSIMCSQKRACMQFKDISTPSNGFEKCSSIDNLCFCNGPTKTLCESASNCQQGETCATVPRIGVTKECVSLALLETIPSNSFMVFGEKEERKGNGVTGDACRFDWDCRSARRCTHTTDKFGGCAGRRACTCEPLLRDMCQTDSDCNMDEKCVNFVDGKTRPFCLSTAVVSKTPDIQGPAFMSQPATPVPGNGLTGDACRDHIDCNGSRSCQHANEISGGCKGRGYCFCQAEFDNNCSQSADCEDGEVCTQIKDSCSQGNDIFPCSSMCMSYLAFQSEPSNVLEEVGQRKKE